MLKTRTRNPILRRPTRWTLESPAALTAAAGLAVICALAVMHGGYQAVKWYPAALFLLGLLLVTAVALHPGPRVPPLLVTAVSLLGAYAAWSLLSVAWASDQGTALAGAGKTVMYAIAFALFALWPLSGRSAALLVGGFGLAVAGIGLVELLRLAGATDPASFFVARRLAEPMGYYNANAALWTIGLLPCALFASRRGVPGILRGLFMSGAVVLLGLALMAQSRGWFFSLPVVLVCFVAIAPARGRLVTALALLGLAAWAMSGPVLDVYSAFRLGPALEASVGDATSAILLTASAAGVVTVVVGLLDNRLSVARRLARATSAGVVTVAAVVALAALAVAAVGGQGPADRVDRAWQEFKQGPAPGAGGSRFTRSLGSGRYDFWRVSWGLFADNPVRGVGADNFQQDYLVRGRTLEQPRWPHSLELRVLSQTGVVGGVLLLAAILAAGVALLWGRRRRPEDVAAPCACAATVFLYWSIHGSVDWFWEFPMLGAVAFAMLGLAAGTLPRPTTRERPRGLVSGRLVTALAALAGVAAAVALMVPWLAELQVSRALGGWRSNPRVAFERLENAEAMNPFASRPPLVAATIALELDRNRRAAWDFRAALKRDPRSQYAYLELGGLAAGAGHRKAALVLFRKAARLAPHDPITAQAIARTRTGERITARQLGKELRDQGQRLVTPR